MTDRVVPGDKHPTVQQQGADYRGPWPASDCTLTTDALTGEALTTA